MKLTRPNAPIIANLAMDFAVIQSAEYADYLMKKGTPEQFDQAPVEVGGGPRRGASKIPSPSDRRAVGSLSMKRDRRSATASRRRNRFLPVL
jgi:hypothetical protein